MPHAIKKIKKKIKANNLKLAAYILGVTINLCGAMIPTNDYPIINVVGVVFGLIFTMQTMQQIIELKSSLIIQTFVDQLGK